MTRKNEDPLFLLSLLPWWVSATIAAAAFVGIVFVFPSLSIEPPWRTFVRPLQSMAIYIGILVAVVLLLPAGVSYIEQSRKKRLLDRQQNLESIRALPWRQFEELVAEAFRREGFTVMENVYGGADGGVDIRLRKGRESYLVQCKNWRKRSVSVSTGREMFGVLAAESAGGVFIVCSGTFTADAVRFAVGKPISLVDGGKLMTMIARVRRGRAGGPHGADAANGHRESSAAKAEGREQGGREPEHVDISRCPWCGGNLVVRIARKGRNAGGRFWGCETFPKCRFVKNDSVSA